MITLSTATFGKIYKGMASVKINGSLCKPFKTERGIRQGCSMSGMLYSLSIEAMLHNVHDFIDGLFLWRMELQLLSGKSIYKYCQVATHKHKLSTRRETVWKERLQGRVPVWSLLNKPPLNKRTGDLQWRILQGALAVNSLVEKINPTVSENCPFCDEIETLVHCYLDCHRPFSCFKSCVFKLWSGLVRGCFHPWCWLR